MKTLWGGKAALMIAVFCFVSLVPAVRADILYDYNSHYTGSFSPFEFQFHASDFLTVTTSIPLADITVIQNPSSPPGCALTGATLVDPGSSSFSVGTFWSAGCPFNSGNAPFNDGPAVSDGIHTIANSITLTISGSPTTTTAPEPSSMLLLGTGLAGVIWRKRVR